VSTWIAILGNEGEEARQKCGRGEKQGSYQGREELFTGVGRNVSVRWRK
jgi:hypothetical protein